MSTEHWEVGPVLSRAWQLFKDNLGVILGAMVITLIINGVFSAFSSNLDELVRGADSGLLVALLVPLRAAAQLVGWAVSVFLTLGMLRLLFNVVRGTGAGIADLFSGGRHLVPALIASLLVGAGVVLGLALFVVPGVILALGWIFVQPLIVDRNMGPIQAMQTSWRLTRGEKGGLFLWMLVCAGLCVAGLLACGLGLLVAAPVCGLGTLLIYEDLWDRAED